MKTVVVEKACRRWEFALRHVGPMLLQSLRKVLQVGVGAWATGGGWRPGGVPFWLLGGWYWRVGGDWEAWNQITGDLRHRLTCSDCSGAVLCGGERVVESK